MLSKISGAKREIQGTEKNFILSSFLTQYYWSDQMEMRWIGAREIFEGKREKHRVFVRTCEGKILFEGLGIEGRIISKCILKKTGRESMQLEDA